MIRIVDKNFRIRQFILHLAMYDSSLNAATIAENIVNALGLSGPNGKSLGLQMANLISSAMDRASTNKAAMDIVHEKFKVEPFKAYCCPHGIAACGKERHLTVGEEVVKHSSAMVKHDLCQARNVHRSMTGESAKKRGGVRWGVEGEAIEQLDRVGLDTMLAYGIRCRDNKWSEASAAKLVDSIEDPHDRAVAMVELAAVVDVGKPLIEELYTCESEEPMVFDAHQSFSDLTVKFGNGVEGFRELGLFDRLEKRAREATELMAPIVVST